MGIVGVHIFIFSEKFNLSNDREVAGTVSVTPLHLSQSQLKIRLEGFCKSPENVILVEVRLEKKIWWFSCGDLF
jgi:hypothetical protein